MNKLKILIPITIALLTTFLCVFYFAIQYHYELALTELTYENSIEYANLQYKNALSIFGTIIAFVGFLSASTFIAITITEKKYK